MDDVQVQFGAKIDQLIAAVAQVNASIQSVSNATQQGTAASAQHAQAVTGHMSQIRFSLQGLMAPIHGIRDSLGELAEAFIAGFAIEKIVEFVKEMADLGIQTQRTANMLGISVAETDLLSGIAKLTGSNIDSLATSIERMSLGIQRSTRDSLGPQAQALKVLGLNAKDLIGIPADQYFQKITEAVNKFNPSLNLTNALQTIGGRGMAELAATARILGLSYHDMTEAVERSSKGIAEGVPAMVQTHTNLSLLGISIESAAAVIFTKFAPAINGIITGITWLVQEFRDAINEGGIIAHLFDSLATTAKLVATAVIAIVAALRALGEVSTQIVKLATGDFESLEKYLEQAKERFVTIATETREAISKIWAPSITVAPKQGQDAGAIDEARRQAIEAAQARIEAEISVLRGGLAQKKAVYDADSAQYAITENTKFRLTMAATQQEFEAEYEKLLKMQALWPAHTKEWENVQKKLVELTQKHGTEMIQLNAESVASMQAKWATFTTSIASSFTTQIRGMLTGTTSFAQAFKNIMLDLVMFFIEQIAKMVAQWAAAQVAQVVASQSAEGAKAAAAIEGEASTLPTRAAAFISNVTADAAQTFAGVFANLASVMGPYAAGPAAAASGTVLAQLAAVPKFDVGSPYVPFTGLAIVHKGERIVTAEDNAKGLGAVPQANISISAWDGRSVMTWLNQGGKRMLAAALAEHYSANPTSRGNY